MVYARLRLFLVLLFLIIGVVLHFKMGIGSAWYLYLGALLLMVTHFLFNNVSAAFVELRKGKIDKAESLIDQIKRPDWLVKRHRAYYYFTKGMIDLQRNRNQEGRVALKKALDLGLRTTNDQALAMLNLAHASYMDKNEMEARHFIATAKKLNSNDLVIKQKITEMEKAMSFS